MDRPVKRILMADDDRDYFQFLQRAIKESGSTAELTGVEDGEQCLRYLRREPPYQDPPPPFPDLLLLDLNMPKKNGFETLREIRTHPSISRLPVIVMTISRAAEDIAMAYALGATSFITKPSDYTQLVEMARALSRYWFDTVLLPRKLPE